MQVAQLLTEHSASLATMQGAYSLFMGERRAYRVWRQQRLHALLKEAGGPKDLARISGVTDTHLIACDKGRRDVGDEMADTLEAAMNKPAGWMDTDPAADSQPALSPDALEIARLYERIPAADRRRMLAVLDAFQLAGPV